MEKAKELRKIYYDPKNRAGYSGQKRLGSSSPVRQWLRGEEAYTLHKPVVYRFPRRKTITGGAHHQYQMDLLDVGRYSDDNKNVKFLLVVIDVFTKYVWVTPLKNKTGPIVAIALKKILSSPLAKNVKSLQSDKGTEFLNTHVQKLLKNKNIKFFNTENEDIKASVAERFNRTLQAKIHRYMTHKKTYEYLNVLDAFVDTYNRQKHSATGFSPSELSKRKDLGDTDNTVWHNLEDFQPEPHYWSKTPKRKLAIGDFVRINKTRKVFRKGYIAAWSKEIFKVSKIRHTHPKTYEIVDQSDEPVKGGFYIQELQPITPPEFYDIEKIVKTRKTKKGVEYFVKWEGYSDLYNSWVSGKNLSRFG